MRRQASLRTQGPSLYICALLLSARLFGTNSVNVCDRRLSAPLPLNPADRISSSSFLTIGPETDYFFLRASERASLVRWVLTSSCFPYGFSAMLDAALHLFHLRNECTA